MVFHAHSVFTVCFVTSIGRGLIGACFVPPGFLDIPLGLIIKFNELKLNDGVQG